MGRIASFLWAAGATSAAFALPASALAQTAMSEPSAQTAAPLPRDTRLAVEVALAELDLTKRALETLHPGYTRYTSAETLDALWEKARADVSQTPSRGRLYLAISRVLAAIRCDHTKAELPKDFEASRDQQPVYLPFRFKIFDDRIFVFNPGETGLERGAEVLSIDGRPVADVLSEVYALFPVDGDTDHIKPESVSEFGEFVGPAFEHFYPFLYPVDETVALEVAGENGAAKAYELPRLTFAQYSAITSEKRFSANFDDAVTLKMMDDQTAYLSIDTFVNYRRPVDPDRIYAPVFAQLESSNTSTLILDLRRNGGGSTDAQIGLLQWLMDKPFQQASAVLVAADRIEPDLRQYLSSWEKAALDPNPAWFTARDDGMFEIALEQVGKPPASIPPKPGAYTGRLIVLTSSDNASGVTHALAVLKAQRDAVFIGEPTGGAATGATAGILAYLDLPESGIRVRVPLQRTVIANAQKLNPRRGIEPDILAPDTLESTFAGTDPALEAALALSQ